MAWIGLNPMKAVITPFDLIPGVGPILKIRSGYRLYRVGKTGYRSRFALGGVEAGKDVVFLGGLYHMSRAGTTVTSSQQQGVHPASIQLAQPSAQKTRRAQGLVSRGSAKRGRERRKPWCRVHRRRHWCRFTRK